MSQSNPIYTLNARNLARFYGNRPVIHNLSLQLQQGEIVGLLGHNGAGKSTTLQMLTGCLIPNSGEIEICGTSLTRHPELAKRHLGYLPETPPLYRELSVQAYLQFAARLHGLHKATLATALDKALQRCGLTDVRKKVIGTLSKGYQQRVGIAQAIIHEPDIVILDEPTVGLDPGQLREIRTLIRDIGRQHSVILSTHMLNDVADICDRVEILHQGNIVYSNTLSNLHAQTENIQQALEDIFINPTRTVT